MRNYFIPVFLLFLFSCSPKKEQLNFHGTNFIIVPAGEYEVGVDKNPVNPKRKVKLNSFAICETEVTNLQFKHFVDSTGYITDAERIGYGMVFSEGMIDWEWEKSAGACWRFPFGKDKEGIENKMDHPVTQVSRGDADAYCKWAGLRLPTIDEWEVAARAGSQDRFPWGNEQYKDGKPMANIWEGESHQKNILRDGNMYTAPVRSYAPNNWGLYDVVGNVFEYCADDLPGYKSDTSYTTGRGGSWWCSKNSCNFFNLIAIGRMARHGSLANQGFRAVKDVE